MTDPGFFQPIESSRLSDEAVRQIKDLITRNVFKPGDKLPSERVLGQQFSVSRASIREALRILEVEGLIVVQSGLGSFVADRRIGKNLSTKWLAWLVEHQEEVKDLLEIREALEPKAAALATTHITTGEIENILEAVDKMEHSAQNGDIEAAVKADIRFHDLISHAARNEFLIKLNDSINYALIESRYAYFQDPERILTSCQQHRGVFEAIQRRYPDGAATAMLEHVTYTKEAMLQIALRRDSDLPNT